MQILTFQTATHLRQLVGEGNAAGLVTFIECRFQPELVGFIQIGATKNFLSHVGVLVEANPFPLYLHGFLSSPDPEKAAKDIKERFARYQLRNAWFRPQQELLEFIRAHATKPAAVGLPTTAVPNAPPDQPEQLLTIEDVAERLKVSTPTIRRLVSAGKIPHIKQGRVLRFQMSQVLQALTEKRPTPTSSS